MTVLRSIGKRMDPAFLPLLIAMLLSVALPLQILIVGSSIGHPDPEKFAQLHLQDGLWWRAVFTFAYFPAAILLHLFAQPANPRFRMLFLAGFSLFLLGNGVDILFRSVQFLIAHGVWAPQLLDVTNVAGHEGARSKILAFNEIAPAIGFCFSLLFAVGRGLMGVVLLLERSKLRRLAGLALFATGLLNLVFALAAVPMLSYLAAAAGPFYLWIWPIGLILVGMATWGQGGNETRGSDTAPNAAMEGSSA